jgi:hypothetical protein
MRFTSQKIVLVICFFLLLGFKLKAQDEFIGKVLLSKGHQLKVLGKGMTSIKFQSTDTFVVYRDTAATNKKTINKASELWQEVGVLVGVSSTLNEAEFKLLKLNNGKMIESGNAIKAERIISLGKYVKIKRRETE